MSNKTEMFELISYEKFRDTEDVRFYDISINNSNFRDLSNCDALFAIVNGVPPDEGVMVELGAAIALGKPTFLFRDDFRKCTDSDEYPLNLMLFLGIPCDGWNDYYYRSIDEIDHKDKAIYKWLKELNQFI